MLPLGRRGPIKIKCLAGSVSTVGGLGLSRRDLDRDSRSRRRKKVSPWSGKSRQFQKVSLDFVSTPPSSSKSLDRDRETGRDMTFWANLDSLSRSRSRVGQFHHISRLRFLNLSRFFILKYFKQSP
jgi:hypothetical protein